MKLYVVRRLGVKCPSCRAVVLVGADPDHDCERAGYITGLALFSPIILSAWPDLFEAKHEAQRWEEDSKIPHDVIEGALSLSATEMISPLPQYGPMEPSPSPARRS